MFWFNMSEGLWIWNAPAWPELSYRAEQLAQPLKRARSESGRLFGKSEAIGASDLASVENEVWSSEAVATAAIEGETLNLASVRSSVARRLGIATDFIAAVPRNIEGLLDVMESAAADWVADLTRERLCRWQAALFPAEGTALRQVETGRYRTHQGPMQIVSGPLGKERVHYVAPPSAAVPAEMHAFLDWFNRSRNGPEDGLLRAGIAHVWFESVHPFEDGNGRIGRAVVDLALAQDVQRATRLHGVSAAMRRRQAEYYDALNKAQRGTGDITEWLDWFLNTFAEACRATSKLIDEAFARARFWSDHKAVALNERQRKVVNKMLEAGPGRFEGGLTLRKYAGIVGTSRATAFRDIEDLVENGLLVVAGTGRGTRYDLALAGWEWKPAAAGQESDT
jgi:Fic family protein